MRIELSKFRIKKGKAHRVDEWMKMLNDRIDEALLTLIEEKMFVESIFREKIGDEEFIYWYTIQGEGRHVSESTHEIDKLHVEFCKECIDLEFPPQHIKPAIHLVSPSVKL